MDASAVVFSDFVADVQLYRDHLIRAFTASDMGVFSR